MLNIKTNEKRLLYSIPRDKSSEDKALVELNIFNNFDHPNISRNIEYFENDNSYNLIFEYVQGKCLLKHIHLHNS